MKTILVGYDASEAAERALDRAAELAEALAARVVVVSVSTVPVPAPAHGVERTGPMLVAAGEATPFTPESQPDLEELAQRRLDQARSRLATRSLDVDYLAEIGSPAERLLAVADERDAELIVVGSRDHGIIERLVAQPVEEAVARRAGRDVLIVH
jgi:nucleotide-binding universal stress UspA family protein